MRCVVVAKQAVLARGGRAARLARGSDATASRLVAAAAEHRRTLAVVLGALRRLGLAQQVVGVGRGVAAERRAIAGADLVVSVGGDGTLLAASHGVRSGSVLGVNSAPGDSVGHFCACRAADVEDYLRAILAGRRRPVSLARLQVLLGGRPLPELALNDVLVANANPAATSRYLLRLGERAEEQRSSGLWVATAAGSTAGIGSAGGAAMPRRSQRLQFRARELYREERRRYRLDRGFVPPGAALEVASKMENGRLWIDGARVEYPFPFGTRALLRRADSPLRLFLDPL